MNPRVQRYYAISATRIRKREDHNLILISVDYISFVCRSREKATGMQVIPAIRTHRSLLFALLFDPVFFRQYTIFFKE